MTKVKVCGLTREADVLAAVDAGVHYLGFVFAPSAREVSPEKAKHLVHVARERGFTGDAVGVFVDATLDRVNEVVDSARLSVVQLHGDESEELLRRAANRTQVWRAVRVRPEWAAEQVTEAGLLIDIAADAILLDRYVPTVVGGTGESFEVELAHELSTKRAVVVAGGLRADSVAEVVRRLRPMAVDVSSGVELSPGVKDAARISAFVDAVRRANEGAGCG